MEEDESRTLDDEMCNKIQKEIESNYHKWKPDSTNHIHIDFTSIRSQTLGKMLQLQPESVFKQIESIAGDSILFREANRCPKICIHIDHFPQVTTLYDLSSDDNKKLIKIVCIVKQVSTVQVRISSCKATCQKCLEKVILSTGCSFCPRCRGTSFSVKDIDPELDYTQDILVRDLYSDSEILVKLTDASVDSVFIGDLVYITGILKAETERDILNLSIKAYYVDPIDLCIASSLFLQETDAPRVQEMAQMDALFPMLLHSIAPDSTVEPMIKAAFLLVMFSTPDDPVNLLLATERGDFLEPLINSFMRIYPRSILSTDLKSKTNSKRSESGGYSLSNGGVLLINDLSKLKGCQNSLWESVENGYECIDGRRTAQAKFSVIATGGLEQPLLGESLDKATGMDPATIACFTLAAGVDGGSGGSLRVIRQLTRTGTPVPAYTFPKWNRNDIAIEDRIKLTDQSKPLTFSETDLRTFSAYARRFVSPKIPPNLDGYIDSAIDEVERRFPNQHRVLKRIEALSRARARCDLRENVTKGDVTDAVETLWWFCERAGRPSGKKMTTKRALIEEFKTAFAAAAGRGSLSMAEMSSIFEEVNASSKFHSLDSLIEILSNEGEILLCPGKRYRLR